MSEEINEAHQWAIATPTKKGGWRRVPDTRFNDQNSAHAYGKKYHTSSIFGPQYKVIPHPDNLKEESMTEEMVEAPHGDPHYHANVHRELINRASGPQKEISLGAHIYRHLSTHPDESHITSHYEKTIYPILKKHGFPREDHGPVGPGHPRHDEHLRFHREFLPDVHKAWREMDKNNPHTAKLLSIADKEAKRKIAEREAEKEAKRQKGIAANKKRMNEEHRITETNPGGEKTRYAVRKHGKSGKPIGQPTIFTTRRGAEEHIARLQKEDVMGGVPTNNMSSGAVADPKNKLLFKKPIKRFKSFTKE